MQINATTKNTNEPTEGKDKDGSAATSLINDVLDSDSVLFHDQFEEPYLAWHGDGRQWH